MCYIDSTQCYINSGGETVLRIIEFQNYSGIWL